MIWKPTLSMVASRLEYNLLFLLYHYVPAFFIDIGLLLSGSKLRLMKIYSKIYYHLQFIIFFMGSTWKFNDTNIQKLYSSMSDDDHKDFPCRLTTKYEQHSLNAAEGLRKYFFKESDEDLPKAQRKYKILRVVHVVFLFFFYSSFTYLLYAFLKSRLRF